MWWNFWASGEAHSNAFSRGRGVGGVGRAVVVWPSYPPTPRLVEVIERKHAPMRGASSFKKRFLRRRRRGILSRAAARQPTLERWQLPTARVVLPPKTTHPHPTHTHPQHPTTTPPSHGRFLLLLLHHHRERGAPHPSVRPLSLSLAQGPKRSNAACVCRAHASPSHTTPSSRPPLPSTRREWTPIRP